MLSAIWTSISKPSSYKRLTQTHLGRAIFTLIFFFAIVTAVGGWNFTVGIGHFVNFMQHDFNDKMPSFVFNGKELHVEQSEPITLTETDKFKLVVDTVNDSPWASLSSVNNGVVLGKTEMHIVNRGAQQSVAYSQFMLPQLTKDDVTALIPVIKPALYVAMVLVFLLTIVWRFVQIFFFSFFARLFGSMQGVHFSYRQAWLLAGFALIPATLINLFNVYLQSVYLNYAFWVAVVTYLYHGVASFKEHEAGRGEQ